MRRTVIVAALFAVAMAGHNAQATSNVSAKYDGLYSGRAIPTPGMSAATCVPFDVARVVIYKGILHSPKGEDQPDIRGFITEEGFVEGSMTRPGGQKYLLEGRLEDELITAGSIDTAANCAWLITLTRQK